MPNSPSVLCEEGPTAPLTHESGPELVIERDSMLIYVHGSRTVDEGDLHYHSEYYLEMDIAALYPNTLISGDMMSDVTVEDSD